MSAAFLFDVAAHERQVTAEDHLAAAGAFLDGMCARAAANITLGQLQKSQRSQESQIATAAATAPLARAGLAKDAFEERAAIIEYDGGLPRAAAERLAHEITST